MSSLIWIAKKFNKITVNGNSLNGRWIMSVFRERRTKKPFYSLITQIVSLEFLFAFLPKKNIAEEYLTLSCCLYPCPKHFSTKLDNLVVDGNLNVLLWWVRWIFFGAKLIDGFRQRFVEWFNSFLFLLSLNLNWSCQKFKLWLLYACCPKMIFKLGGIGSSIIDCSHSIYIFCYKLYIICP